MLETALNQELTEHLGHDKHDPAGRGGNFRNGSRAKTVLTEAPARWTSRYPGTGTALRAADRPQAAAAADRGREMVMSLSAKGLTPGEIAAHFAEVYGA